MATTHSDDIYLSVRDEFSIAPGPRYRDEGDYSGEEFRETIVKNKVSDAIQNNLTITIDLDGTNGYGTSFLEEVFGGLIREDNLAYADIKKALKLISNEEDYLIGDVEQYLKDAFDEEG